VSGTSFQEALAYLYDLQKYGIKFGSPAPQAPRQTRNPHLHLKAVHIAGTNGKDPPHYDLFDSGSGRLRVGLHLAASRAFPRALSYQ